MCRRGQAKFYVHSVNFDRKISRIKLISDLEIEDCKVEIRVQLIRTTQIKIKVT